MIQLVERMAASPPPKPLMPVKLPKQYTAGLWEKVQDICGSRSAALPRLFGDPANIPPELQDQLAHLNFATKKIEANLSQIKAEVGLDKLLEILCHEFNHWKIPGTLKTFMLLTHNANKVLEDEQLAGLARNLFDDFEDNSDLLRGRLHTIADVYRILWHDRDDLKTVQIILGRAYEIRFQTYDTSKFYKGYIVPSEKVTLEYERAAHEIVPVFQDMTCLNWCKAIREFSRILKPFFEQMKQEAQQQGQGARMTLSQVGVQNFFPPGQCPIPPQGKADIKKIEGRLNDVTIDLGKEEGKDQPACSIQEFQGFLAANNIEVELQKALVWLYRDSVRNKTVKVPEVTAHSGSLYPYALTTWRPSDSPMALDVQTSLMAAGTLIPALTTKKWVYKSGHHLTIGRDYPDLIIVGDASGSMESPMTTYSPAIGSLMIVSHSFIQTRKKVYALIFSEGKVAATANFTSSEDELDDVLVTYAGSGTELPYDDIDKPFKLNDRPKYFVMITDLEIGNIEESRFRSIYEQSCGGTIFLISRGQDVSDTQKLLEDIGFTVVPIQQISDLEGQALKLTKQLFEERIEV